MKKAFIIALLALGFLKAEAQTQTNKVPCSSVTYIRTSPSANNFAKRTSYTVPRRSRIANVKPHVIAPADDNMHNPYEGKASQQNDGVKKNEMRNLNSVITSTGGDLPPNDGGR